MPAKPEFDPRLLIPLYGILAPLLHAASRRSFRNWPVEVFVLLGLWQGCWTAIAAIPLCLFSFS